MKNQTQVTAPQTTYSTIVPLHHLVDQLMNGLVPLAACKKSFIINDIDKNFELKMDEQVLAFVVGNIMSNAVTSTSNVCIRVEAVVEEGNVQIRVRNNGSCFHSTITQGFNQVLQAARQLGGHISISNHRSQGTTVVFSVAGQADAA